MRAILVLVGSLLALGAMPVLADVTAVDAGGFAVKETFQTGALPDRVWAALIQPKRWWDSQHTFSGSAANLSFEARVGGCWCETLPNGGAAQHMQVDYLDPGKALRLRGALGPLGALPVTGVMNWALAPQNAGTEVTVTYAIAGWSPSGLKELAPAVDSVLKSQTDRLKALLEKS
jgi:uncharacterized protein YndB with AHSA1/START domain